MASSAALRSAAKTRATKHVVETTGDGILSTQLEEQASTANIAYHHSSSNYSFFYPCPTATPSTPEFLGPALMSRAVLRGAR